MKFPKIRLPKKLMSKIGKISFKIGRKKPEICLAAGIILGGGALVLAAVETWNGKDQIIKDSESIKSLKEYEPTEEPSQEALYPTVQTESDKKKMLLKFYGKTGLDIIKIYWKPVVMSGTSLVLIITSHKMLRKSLAEMAAMYAGLLESYRQYRKNVIDEYGIEKDQEFMYGAKKIEAIDSETGEAVEKIVPTGKPYHSRYAVWYDEGLYDDDKGKWIWKNPLFSKNRSQFEANIFAVQTECNDILRMRGYIFLNEVRSKLGLPPVIEGQHMGWVRSGLLNGKGGDDYIDFGVFPDFCNGKYQLPVNRSFLDYSSNQKYPLIDFNCTCIDSIFDDIYEYDNRSSVSYDRRAETIKGFKASEESLDRWFSQNSIRGE